MASTTAGMFYPTTQYTNDLSRLVQSTWKILPSKFISYGSVPYDTSGMDTAIDSARTEGDDVHVKEEAWKLISTTAVSCGDIVFVSTDVTQGLAYSEIYVHLTGQDHAPKFYDAGTVVTADKVMVQASDSYPATNKQKYSFQYLVLLYDIYEGDALVCKDQVMGQYVLYEPQTLISESDQLYGAGTSWAVRICSRVTASDTADAIGISGPGYNSLTAILSQFGDLTSQMRQILNKKYDDITTVKQYLENFKNIREVNVPYVSDDGKYWMVNGKPVTEITGGGSTSLCECEGIPSETIARTLI